VAEEASSAGERVGGWWGSMDLVRDGQGGLAGRGPRRWRGPAAAAPGPSPALTFQSKKFECIYDNYISSSVKMNIWMHFK
jgi:hypothetical protein